MLSLISLLLPLAPLLPILSSSYPPFSDDSASRTIFEKILNDSPEIPEFFSPEAKDIIERLLIVDHNKRLGGCSSRASNASHYSRFHHSGDDIKKHPFFREIDWDRLEKKITFGPLNPNIKKDGDTHNFYKFSEGTFQEETADKTDNYDQIFKGF